MPLRIEDYALIGDCETAALVGCDGSVDWLCWPRFDSDACFTALLGAPEHGRWLIAPAASNAHTSRQYRGDTLILETRFETVEGAALLQDFMLSRQGSSALVRLVRGERGRLTMRTELVIRFGYGALVPWVQQQPDGSWRAVAGPDQVVLRTPTALRYEELKLVGEFAVTAGEVVPFTLRYAPSHLAASAPLEAETVLAETEQFWSEWANRARIEKGEHFDAVMRSLLTLKALTYAPTGGIVAAPTTSLPETLGGGRNWDYRFCWLRDATLSLLALMNAGYYEEAGIWRDWLLRAVAGVPTQAQIMYGLRGERRLSEWEVDWLPGYEGARPVRIGNGAHDQLQIDVYGELMDALYQAQRGGLASSADGWALQRAMLAHLAEIWREPDRGIWEVRGAPRHFTFSKVMAWVAFDRGVKLIEQFGLEGPAQRWRDIRGEIHAEVCQLGYNERLGSFVQSYGAAQLDGSLLLLPTTGFLPPDDPRMRGTVKAVEKHLLQDGFVARYDTRTLMDGLPNEKEGTFLACSFWLVDNYVLQGRGEEAQTLFERLLALRNDVGLLSEEYDVCAGRLVGNFPQAFSHIALVNTAQNLGRPSKPTEQRAGQTEPGK